MKPQKHPLPLALDQKGEPIQVNKAVDERLIKDEPFVRNPYNYNADLVSHASGLRCDDPSLTQQQFLQEADINYIAEKFMRTGELKNVLDMPTAGDFEGIFDFQSAMNLVVEAKQQFMDLPAKIRSRFDNDPAKLLEFLDREENRKEAEALGLVKTPDPKPAEAPTIDAPQAPASKPGTPPSVQPEAPKKG